MTRMMKATLLCAAAGACGCAQGGDSRAAGGQGAQELAPPAAVDRPAAADGPVAGDRPAAADGQAAADREAAPNASGPDVIALGPLTIHLAGGDATEIRLHADGRVETRPAKQGWRPGPTLHRDGRVVHGGNEVGRIGAKDGRPQPAETKLASGMQWGVESVKGGVLLQQADGNAVALARDGSMRLIVRDEHRRKISARPYGRVEGAADHQLARTALWIVGLYYGGEVRMWHTDGTNPPAYRLDAEAFLVAVEQFAAAAETAGSDCARMGRALAEPARRLRARLNPDELPSSARQRMRDVLVKIGAARKRADLAVQVCLEHPDVEPLVGGQIGVLIHGGGAPQTR